MMRPWSLLKPLAAQLGFAHVGAFLEAVTNKAIVLSAHRAPIAPELHERTLVVHGEVDDTVPLADVMNWARPQKLPVTVIPGVEHFFHGQLTLLRSLVARHLMSELPSL